MKTRNLVLLAALLAMPGVVAQAQEVADDTAARTAKQGRMDVNGDGNIDKGEFMAQAEQKFRKLDTNGDGVISKDERPKRRGHAGKRHGTGGQP
jgi:hypothetical protein